MNIVIKEFNQLCGDRLYQIHCSEMMENDKMTKENFFSEFSEESRKYFVAFFNSEIVGYVGLFDCYDDINIIGIAVDKSYQNKGIGSALLKVAKEFAKNKGAKSLSLEVDKNNVNAQNFYKKNGFVVTNIRKKYYKDSDAFVMFFYL